MMIPVSIFMFKLKLKYNKQCYLNFNPMRIHHQSGSGAFTVGSSLAALTPPAGRPATGSRIQHEQRPDGTVPIALSALALALTVTRPSLLRAGGRRRPLQACTARHSVGASRHHVTAGRQRTCVHVSAMRGSGMGSDD